MYQARSLIGSDASGLSDPYAQIIFGENSTKTQVFDRIATIALFSFRIDLILFYRFAGDRRDFEPDLGRTADHQRSDTVRDQRRHKETSAEHRGGNI